MSTPNEETAEQLQAKIKRLSESKPCIALRLSLSYLNVKGWLPKFEFDEDGVLDEEKMEETCESTIRAYKDHLKICRPLVLMSGEVVPATEYQKRECSIAYKWQMEVAKCRLGKAIRYEYGRPSWLKDPEAAYDGMHENGYKYKDVEDLCERIRTVYMYSPNPVDRFFQQKGLLENPKDEMEQMSSALKKSYEHYDKCRRLK